MVSVTDTNACSLVDAAEDPAVTTGYTDYFPADGMQTTLTIHCAGAENIQKCKSAFLVNGRELVVSSCAPSPLSPNDSCPPKGKGALPETD